MSIKLHDSKSNPGKPKKLESQDGINKWLASTNNKIRLKVILFFIQNTNKKLKKNKNLKGHGSSDAKDKL